MLQVLHERYKGWIAWAIIILISITLAIFGIENYFARTQATDVVAKVNGQPISLAQFNQTYEQLKRMLQQQLAVDMPQNQSLIEQLKQEALNQLITAQVLFQSAVDHGYRVSSEQAGQAIMSMPMFQKDHQFSPVLYEQILAKANQTPSRFLAEVENNMLLNQAKFGLAESSFLLRNEFAQNVLLLNQKRDFRYLIVQKNIFPQIQKSSLQEQENYYQTHIQQFNNPEKVQLAYIKLSFNDLIARQTVTTEEIKNQYEENKAQYTQPEQYLVAQILVKNDEAKIKQVMQKLKQGQSFDKLAKTYSEDVLTAKHGGVLPWTTIDKIVDATLARAVSGLKKPKDFTEIIHTKYGYQIIQLISLKPKQTVPYDYLAPKIEKMLKQQKAEQNFLELSEQIANLAYTNPNSLEPISKELNLKIETTDWFDRSGASAGIIADSKVIQAAFSPSVLTQNNNSEPIRIDNQNLVVARLKAHQPAQPKPFKEVQTEIEKKLEDNKRSLQADDLAHKIAEGLKNQKNIQSFINPYHLKWTSVQNVDRNSTDPLAPIVKAAFQLANPTAIVNKPVTIVQLPSGDYAVIVLEKIQMLAFEKIPQAQRQLFLQQFTEQLGQQDYNLYIQYAVQKADIKKYPIK